jgi:anti-anti-sigma factor
LSSVRPERDARGGILIKLRGEWDIRGSGILRQTLGSVLGGGLPAFVDLSGVTFMDSRCIEELAVHYQMHRDEMVPCNPSPQVELGVAACGLEEWICFVRL